MSLVLQKLDILGGVVHVKLDCRAARELMYTVANGKEPSRGWLSPLKRVPELHSDEVARQSADAVAAVESAPVSLATASAESTVETAGAVGEETGAAANRLRECLLMVETFCDRIKLGLHENGTAFLPAVEKMDRNIQKFASTESGLLTTLHTMGRYAGVLPGKKRTPLNARRHGQMIGVQPTAIARRKFPLSGRRSQHGGRPLQIVRRIAALQQHDYGNFNQPRRKKAIHNLQSCVYSNTSLGTSRQAR